MFCETQLKSAELEKEGVNLKVGNISSLCNCNIYRREITRLFLLHERIAKMSAFSNFVIFRDRGKFKIKPMPKKKKILPDSSTKNDVP